MIPASRAGIITPKEITEKIMEAITMSSIRAKEARGRSRVVADRANTEAVVANRVDTLAREADRADTVAVTVDIMAAAD